MATQTPEHFCKLFKSVNFQHLLKHCRRDVFMKENLQTWGKHSLAPGRLNFRSSVCVCVCDTWRIAQVALFYNQLSSCFETQSFLCISDVKRGLSVQINETFCHEHYKKSPAKALYFIIIITGNCKKKKKIVAISCHNLKMYVRITFLDLTWELKYPSCHLIQHILSWLNVRHLL